MLELGEDSTSEHDAIGRLAVRLNISRLVVVGDTARPMASGAQHEGSWGDEAVWVPDADAAYDLLAEELRPGDVVLFKSSRDAGLRWLGDRLAGSGTADRKEGTT
jgi:UDP-N-acetylmuramoyl-tripeptide--D-alanyl-D-alanine ligase